MDIKKVQIEIDGEMKDTDYFISSDGKLLKEITSSCNGNGYALAVLYKDGIGHPKNIHRLVANAFLEKVDGKDYINHINGNKLDNRVENLEWCTPQENTEHYHRELRKEKPMYNQKACFQILDGEIMAEYKSLHDASRRTGISVSNIYCCCKGRTTTAGGYQWQYKES